MPLLRDRLLVLRLFYTYCEIGVTDLKDIPLTNLITHRIQLKNGVEPWKASN